MLYPSPWLLKGRGVILTHSFKKSWIKNNGFIPDHMKNNFIGGLSFTMLVDYQESNCGPYKELLFIPGLFRVRNRNHLVITKIYVDSEESLQSGRKNWGIPKELAEISWIQDHSTLSFSAHDNNDLILKAKFRLNPFYFPLSSQLSPFHIYHELNDQCYLFKPNGYGRAALCKLKELDSSPDLFPKLSDSRFCTAMHVKNFDLYFPCSKIERL